MEDALHAGAAEPGLKLIETMAWDGAALVRLPLHLERLERSARLLRWTCDRAAVAAALVAAVPVQAARMRLTLDAGGLAVTVAPMPAVQEVWTLGLASERLWSGDPWLRVKSTHRPAYDAARASIRAGLDEVILLNERDEVCDGSITTVFFDRGEGLRTPPDSAGLLPGVLRAAMLASGEVRQETLLAADLGRVRLWLGNSLRGLGTARWVAND